MKFYLDQSNLTHTARHLIEQEVSNFVGRSEEQAVEMLGSRALEVFKRHCDTEGFAETADGAKIWNCYKGVCALFTQVSETTYPVFHDNDTEPDRRIMITFYSYLG